MSLVFGRDFSDMSTGSWHSDNGVSGRSAFWDKRSLGEEWVERSVWIQAREAWRKPASDRPVQSRKRAARRREILATAPAFLEDT
jgi:hypothetical protein